MSHFEHYKTIRPSHLLQAFLFFALPCEIFRLRTLFLIGFSANLLAWEAARVGIVVLLLGAESWSKHHALIRESKTLSPENTTGLFSQSLFWYLNTMFFRGYYHTLRPANLLSVDPELLSESIEEGFQLAWSKVEKPTSPHALSRVVFSVLKGDLFRPVLPRILQGCMTLMQPFLISAMVSFVQKPSSSSAQSEGYFLLAAFASNYFLLAIFSSWYAQSVSRFQAKLKLGLVSIMYSETLKTKAFALDANSATVLMNVDMERIMGGAKFLHEIWAAPISSAIALYILYSRIGATLAAPLATILLATVASSATGNAVSRRQNAWAEATDSRVEAIAHAVISMKAIRMMGMSGPISRTLHGLRTQEVFAQKRLGKYLTLTYFLANTLYQVALFVTYTTTAIIALRKDRQLSYATLFTSLSALRLATSPLGLVLQLITALQVAATSLARIQSLLIQSDPSNNPLENWRPRLESCSGAVPIEIIDGIAGASPGEVHLYDINLCISKGTFALVCGKTGAGKSMLLRSIIGETEILHGDFGRLSSGAAFCAQSPWLRNATVFESIIEASPYDKKWYHRVIWACGLQEDLEKWQDGDSTMIGSNGAALSGGQKNRIALARALYSLKPILVVDDVLCGLDKHTERVVFARVFGKDGILRKSGCTTILATHSTHFADQADTIILMSEGRISGKGTYLELSTTPELLEEHGVPSHLYSWEDGSPEHGDDPSKDEDDPSKDEEDPSKDEDDPSKDEDDPSKDEEDPSKDGDDPSKDEEDPSKDEEDPSKDEDDPSKDEEDPSKDEDDPDARIGDTKSLVFYLRSFGTFNLSIFSILIAAATVATAGQFMYLKAIAGTPDIHKILLFTLISVLDVVLIGGYIAYFFLVCCPNSSLRVHNRQLTHLVRARYSSLTKIDAGDIINRFSQDVAVVDGVLNHALLSACWGLCSYLLALITISIATPPLSALLPFLFALCWAVQRIYLRTARQLRLIDLEAKAPLCASFLETVSGMVTIRAFGWSQKFQDRNRELLVRSLIPFHLLNSVQNWLTLVLRLMVTGIISVLVGVAIAFKSKIDAAFLGLALVGSMDLSVSITVFIQAWAQLETALSAISRIRQFCSNTPQEPDTNGGQPPHRPSTQSGTVEFESVTAGYSRDGPAVFENLNLKILAGEKLAICGKSGSGKSSLVLALSGMMHVRCGNISIDSVYTGGVASEHAHDRIIALPQDPFIIPGTVRENLTPRRSNGGPQPSIGDEDMERALIEVGLWPKLSEAAEPGATALDILQCELDSILSHGERQLFCLARATLQEGSIVVLDEATSSLDTATEELAQKTIRRAFREKTVIAIVHHLDTILDFDRVVVMDAGRIVEMGSPKALLARERGAFKKLLGGSRPRS